MIPRRAARPLAALLATGLATLALATVPASGQERPEDGTVFTGETQVLAVEVPVQVLVKGEPVRGLTAEDFRVYAGDEVLPLTGFEVVDLAVTAATGAAAAAAPERPAALSVPPAGRRHFLLFFDLSFTRAGYLSRGLEGARKLVREGLHPSDLVGVAFYNSRQGVTLALQFTPDRVAVERVLDAFEVLLDDKKEPPPQAVADAGSARPSDPLGLTAGGPGATLAEVGQAAGYQTSGFAEAARIAGNEGGGRGGFLMADLLAHSSELMEQAIQEQRGAQVAYLADNLKALARALGGIEGSKHLVLLSQGFDVSLLEVSPGSGSVGSGGGSWLLRAVNEMVVELRASGWVIHGADVGGIADYERSGFSRQTRAGLFYLADETGGTLVENTNDLAAGLEDVLERTSVTYVLTFQVEDVRDDGSFHQIRVELVDGPRGATLVHRTGFHAPRPPGERQPFELRAEAAARILAGDEVGGLPAAVRATALAYTGESARVPVLVEITGRDLLERGPAEARASAELYVYAFDGEGAVAGFFAHSVALDPVSTAEGPARGVKLAGELDLPPGRYEIRVLVRGAGAGQEAVRILDLEVPAVSGEPGLLPPLFMQGTGERWVVAALGDGGADEAYPFVVEGKRIAPAAVPVLAPGQAARLLLPGVGLSQEGLRLETRIVTEAGERVLTGQLRILGRRSPEAGQPDLLVAELDPQALAPGAYRLEVTIAGTGHRVTAPFRVDR